MPTYTAPVRDMEFVLNDVLKVQSGAFKAMKSWKQRVYPLF